jgi:acid phosphatase type 7
MKAPKIIFRLFICLLFCLLFSRPVSADKTLLGNEPGTPERICLTITQNPHHTQAVSWRTAIQIKSAKAQISTITDFINQKSPCKTINTNSKAVKISEGKVVYHHSVVFDGLLPDTWYTYRVGDHLHWSEWNRFKTASNNSNAFEFLYFGDIQNKIRPLCSQVLIAAAQTVPEARFWLFAGDLVNDGSDDNEWYSFFNALGWMAKSYPLALVAGNHEYPHPRQIKTGERKITKLWQPHFNLPQNGPKGLEQTCYHFEYQGVFFLVLNGNEKLEEQARWMERILRTNKLSWIIVAIHQPIYSTSKKRNVTIYQNLFAPIFDRFGVDLVLQGHDHAYSRTFPLKNHEKTKPGEKGTIYLMSITGPKSYPIDSRYAHLFAASTVDKQLFQSVRVEPKKIEVKAFDLSGKIFDTFELHK